MDRRFCSTLLALALGTITGCDSGAKAPAHDTFSLVGGVAGQNIASITYGATSEPIALKNGFGYGWLRFSGRAGDAVDIWVRGDKADAVAFLLDGEDNLIAANDDATAGVNDAHLTATLTSDGTYFIAFRDHNYGRARFTVSAQAVRRASAPAPSSTPVTRVRPARPAGVTHS
jgi:hypothetical protein